MGRPINKKYFGNTSVPPIGGEGVASIAVGGTNTGKTAVPAIVIAAPELPEGVQAVARAHMEVESVVNFLNGVGYEPRQILTLQEAGAVGTAGTLEVITTEVSTVAIADSGTGGWTTGTTVVTVATGEGTAATVTVTADELGAVTGVEIATRGSYTTNPSLTDVAVVGGPEGNGLLLDLTMQIGTVEVSSGGDYTELPADVTRFSVTTGTADFNLTFKVKSVEVTTAGAGYVAAPAITTQGGTTFTATLTSGTGGNSITMTGLLAAGSAVAFDILKQTGSLRYLVTDGTNTGVVELVADAADEVGEANIVATDSLGSTYYVTKLTSRRARLAQLTDGGSGFEFETGAVAGWTLGAATTGVVSIANS